MSKKIILQNLGIKHSIVIYNNIDISNNVFKFLSEPKSYFDKENKIPILSYIEHKCSIYSNEIIYKIVNYTNISYLYNLYCGIRILIDKFNITVGVNIFYNYMNSAYKIITDIFHLIASSVFLNILNFGLEVINYFMLFILLISCSHNFLSQKSDIIKQVT
jgi:hypothetical protein